MRLSATLYKLVKLLYLNFPFKKFVCFILKFINFKIDKFYKDFRFEGVFKVSVFKEETFLLHHFGGKIENETFWKGLFTTFEREMGWLWIELSKKSEVIIDIGANTGIYSLVSQTVNSDSLIYAFEPSKNTFSKLQQNVSINNFNINCFPIALSNHSGSQVFYDSYDSNQTSASMSHKMHALWENYAVNSYEVKTQTLDDFIYDNNIHKIDLVKLDVEMFEPEVIEGFLGEIFIKQPIIFIEVLSEEVGERLMLLLNNQYAYYHLDKEYVILRKNQLIPIPLKWNYLICPQDKVEWFEKEYNQFISN
jgi:FkbM family methyltransferase